MPGFILYGTITKNRKSRLLGISPLTLQNDCNIYVTSYLVHSHREKMKLAPSLCMMRSLFNREQQYQKDYNNCNIY